MIPINQPMLGKEEIDVVAKVLKSGGLTHGLGAGPMVTVFEGAFAKFVKVKHAIATNTGTGALHLALASTCIGSACEVIVPSFTFVATAEAIVFAGAKPVFVDIDPETYTIDPETIEKVVTKRTRVIMPVDLYGLPVAMKRIREIADKHNLKIVEDAAQAHGATYCRKPAGWFADVACWSFYGSKNMTTGEGGMVTTDCDENVDTMRFMRSHGEKEKYNSVMLGHNYHMPEMEAAIGIEQLKKLPKFVAKRRRNAERLNSILEKSKRLQLPIEPEGSKSSWYLYTVRLKSATREKRDAFVDKLRQKGIGSVVCYVNPIHLMSYYRKFGERKLPVTEEASNQVLSLPVHPAVTEKQIDFIGNTVLKLLK